MGKTVIYKYRPVNPHTERILTHTELWCSAPSTLNDLHECCFRTDVTVTDSQLDSERNWWRICCFGGDHDNLLMWSHYAQQHHGICIGFSVQDDAIYDPAAGKESGEFHKVYYPGDDAIPLIRFRGKLGKNAVINQVITAMTTKSRHWKYEKEYRLLTHPSRPNVMKYTTTGTTISLPPASLTQVYLGARIRQDDQNTVVQWLLSREHPVELFKARRHEKKYALVFDSLGIVNAR